MKVALEEDADDAVLRVLVDGMRAFNNAAVQGLKSHKIVAAIRDDDGTLQGGVVGRMAGDSIYMEIVYNDDAVRGTGLGRETMALVEIGAERRSAHQQRAGEQQSQCQQCACPGHDARVRARCLVPRYQPWLTRRSGRL